MVTIDARRIGREKPVVLREGDIITARVFRSGDEPRYETYQVPYPLPYWRPDFERRDNLAVPW